MTINPVDGMPLSGGPWTRHGHPIPGVTVYPVSVEHMPKTARCGGVAWCADCRSDAEAAR